MTEQRFETTLEKPDASGTWTYFTVPFVVEKAFGSKSRVKVKGTIDSFPFRSSLMPRGDGTHYMVVKKSIRDAIGKGRGDTIKVSIDIDTEVRDVNVPEDFRSALAMHKKALTVFQTFSYSHKKEYVDWIETAKRPETRIRRIHIAVEKIAEGIRLK